MGIGVSDQTVDITGIRVDRLVQGKVAESWDHWDSLKMLRQIGALPDLARNPKASPWAQAATSLPTPFPPPSAQAQKPGPSAEQLKSAA